MLFKAKFELIKYIFQFSYFLINEKKFFQIKLIFVLNLMGQFKNDVFALVIDHKVNSH